MVGILVWAHLFFSNKENFLSSPLLNDMRADIEQRQSKENTHILHFKERIDCIYLIPVGSVAWYCTISELLRFHNVTYLEDHISHSKQNQL